MSRHLIAAFLFLLPWAFSLPSASGQAATTRLQFPNTDVREVLFVYEQLTGSHVLYDNNVQGTISIVIAQPVTEEEAIALIESSLTLNGYSLVKGDGNTVKVIGIGKNPRAANVPFFTQVSQLPEGNTVVNFLYRLEYLPATDAQQALQSFVFPQPYTLIQPLERIQGIVITESVPVIRSCVALLESIDTPPAEVVSRFFVLKSADAVKVVENLAKIFESEDANQPGTPTNRNTRQPNTPNTPNNPAAAQPQPAASSGTITISEDSIIVGKIKLTPDERSNRIHVVTRPENMPLVERLITEFDSNVAFAAPTKFKLNYVSAGEVLPVIVKAITEPGVEAEAPESTGGQSTTGGGGGGGGVTSGGGGTSGGGSISFSEQLRAQEVDTKPVAAIVGNTKLIADQRDNAIIVLGTADVKDKVSKLITEIDVRAPQVVIETIIGELSLNDDQEIGFDYFVNNTNLGTIGDVDINGGGVGNTTGGRFDLANITNLNSLLRAVAAPSGLNAYIAVGDIMAAIVTALKQTGRFQITSNPTLFTSNNKKAIIASGEEIAVPSQTVSTIDVTQPVSSSSIQFKTVALQLEVLPLVNPNGEVTLEILQKVDNTAGTTNISGNEIPNIATRFLRTSVTIKSGDTIALGGLIIAEEETDESGIPYLMDVPYLGNLFKTEGVREERRELVILMRPTIIESNHEAREFTRQEKRKLEIAQNPGFQEIEYGVKPVKRALKVTPRDLEQVPLVPVEGVVYEKR